MHNIILTPSFPSVFIFSPCPAVHHPTHPHPATNFALGGFILIFFIHLLLSCKAKWIFLDFLMLSFMLLKHCAMANVTFDCTFSTSVFFIPIAYIKRMSSRLHKDKS